MCHLLVANIQGNCYCFTIIMLHIALLQYTAVAINFTAFQDSITQVFKCLHRHWYICVGR